MHPSWKTALGVPALVAAMAGSAGGATGGDKVKAVTDKTLVVWASLANLTQRGGGALTLENPGGQFDAVVVPGGWAPDKLRRYPAVTGLVRDVYLANKVVASICHGGLVLISAGVVKGRRATGSQGIKDDLINAGAQWTYDEEAFRDGNLVWGRVVPDIPAFCRELVQALAEA